jgi:predicted site-specific integrase-resolvase
MTLVDAAKRLGMTRQGLHKAASRGQIRGALLGQGVWVFRRAVVEREAADREANKKKAPPE